MFNKGDEETYQLGKEGKVHSEVVTKLSAKYDIRKLSANSNKIMLPYCQKPQLKCKSNNPFRLANGECNNLDRPLEGSSYHVYNYFLEPKYDDGIGSPRQKNLPSEVSC